MRRQAKKLGGLSENYSACFKFFNEIRWYVVFSLGLFALFFIIGFIFPIFFKEEIFKFILEMLEMMEGKSVFEMMQFIFLNNLKASFFSMVLGISFGIFPLIVGVFNGYLLGFVARETVATEGIFILWRLFPHGIFELPAIIFSIAIGFKIGTDLFRQDQKVKYNFREGFRFFAFVIFPLLLIAGIIESLFIVLL